MSYKIERSWVRLATNQAPSQPVCGRTRGDCPVRLIYLAESGTSNRETVTVVAGVIVNPDKHSKAVV